MREQIYSSGSFDLDELKSRMKMSSLRKSGIAGPGLCVCEYGLRILRQHLFADLRIPHLSKYLRGECQLVHGSKQEFFRFLGQAVPSGDGG